MSCFFVRALFNILFFVFNILFFVFNVLFLFLNILFFKKLTAIDMQLAIA